jgi:NAD(P)-dependent dehydrogenase (short-subunit alcohol dehydrogenase family)
LALAEEFGRRGARLVLAARDEAELQRARTKLLECGAIREEKDVLLVAADSAERQQAQPKSPSRRRLGSLPASAISLRN